MLGAWPGHPDTLSAWSDVFRSCGASETYGSRLFYSGGEKGLAHLRSMNAQVTNLGLRLWRYSPLTRTQCKPLTCDFATPWRSPALCAPRPSAQRPWNLCDRLNERYIADLITAYRQGATASLAAAPGLSVNSVKRLLHIVGAHRTSPPR
jgi:hypothetical protein